MAEEPGTPVTEAAAKSRREFVRSSARVAVTAPAVALLLSASMKRAYAVQTYLLHSNVDDPNAGEDLDSRVLGNYNPFNGGPQRDDRV